MTMRFLTSIPFMLMGVNKFLKDIISSWNKSNM